MIKYEKPDYKRLAKTALVTVREAIWFLTYPELLDSEFTGDQAYNSLAENFITYNKKKVCSALDSNEIKFICGPDYVGTNQEGNKIYDIDKVLVFVCSVCKWAALNEYMLPKELMSLVEEPDTSSITANNHFESKNSDVCQLKPVIEDQTTVDSSSLKIQNSSKSEVADSASVKRGQAGGKSLWADRKPLENCASQYIDELLNINCTCRHDILAQITYMTATHEGKTIAEHDKTPMGPKKQTRGLKHLIKQIAMEKVPEERKFQSKNYDRLKCECQIEDHKKYTNRNSS